MKENGALHKIRQLQAVFTVMSSSYILIVN
jgi:hypothetical protein